MSKRSVEVANTLPDVFFNMSSLKYKILTLEPVCGRCSKKESAEWFIIGRCHHMICSGCLRRDVVNHCNQCNTRFHSVINVSHNKDLKRSFLQVEELIYYVKALDKGLVRELAPDVAIKRRCVRDSPKNANDSHNDDIMMQEIQNANSTGQQNTNPSTSESHGIQNHTSTNLDDSHNDDIMVQEIQNTNSTGQQNTNPSSSESHGSNVSSVVINRNDILTQDEVETDAIDIELAEEEEDRVSNISMDLTSNNEEISENINEQNDNDDSNSNNNPDSSGSSDNYDDIIIGTPERNSRLPIVLACTGNATVKEIKVVKKMACMFNLQTQTRWSSNVTHVIVVLNVNGKSDPNQKFLIGMLRNCFLVTLKWVQDCVSSKSLLPEANYMAPNLYGDTTPSQISLQVRKGEIESPMKWCNICGLYFHDSLNRDIYQRLFEVANIAGFVVLNRLEDFNNSTLKIRVIITNNINDCREDRNLDKPDNKLIMDWINNYKAVTVGYDWFIECIVCYSFVPFKYAHQHMPIESSLIESANLDKSLFDL